MRTSKLTNAAKVSLLLLTVLQMGCGERPLDEGLELGAANASSSASESRETPPLYNPYQPSTHNSAQPPASVPYTYQSPSPSSTESNSSLTENPVFGGYTYNGEPVKVPADQWGRTYQPTFGPDLLFGYWKLERDENGYRGTDNIFILAQYGEENWHDQYNNILALGISGGCFALAKNKTPFELVWIGDILGSRKLQTLEGDTANYSEFSYNAGEDQLIRRDYKDGEMYLERFYLRLWAGLNREDMLDCERVAPE